MVRRRAPSGDLFIALAAASQDRGAAAERLPALHDHVAVLQIEFHEPRLPSVFSCAIIVEPEPRNGSSTISRILLEFRIARFGQINCLDDRRQTPSLQSAWVAWIQHRNGLRPNKRAYCIPAGNGSDSTASSGA